MARKQEELQHLGFLGIFKESFKIIFSRPNIFMQITLFFILPISFLAVASNLVPYKLSLDHVNLFPTALYDTSVGFPPASYNEIPNTNSVSKAGFYVLAFVAYFLLSFVFSLLSVSTVVYTVVCIQTGKDITFRKAISVVPRVWKQVILTYLSLFGITFVISAVFFLVMTLFIIIFMSSTMMSSNYSSKSILGVSIGLIIVSLLFLVGIFYTSIIWLLGDVVSVLEKICGIKALKKSKALIKGKMGTTISVYLGLVLCTVPNIVFLMKLRNNEEGKRGERICYGILSLVLSTLVTLFTLVVKSVLYLVCKSYHHEPIDKLSWVDYIEVSSGDHLPLNKIKEKQVEDLQV